MSETRQYVSCTVGDLLIGLRVDVVREVTSGSDLTPVPLASPLVSGLLNLRGEIVTAIDLRRCLQLADRPAGERAVNLILRSEDSSVSLLVDQVGDVLEVGDDQIQPPPRTLTGAARDLITGIHKLDGRLLLMLDTDGVLSFSSGELH